MLPANNKEDMLRIRMLLIKARVLRILMLLIKVNKKIVTIKIGLWVVRNKVKVNPDKDIHIVMVSRQLLRDIKIKEFLNNSLRLNSISNNLMVSRMLNIINPDKILRINMETLRISNSKDRLNRMFKIIQHLLITLELILQLMLEVLQPILGTAHFQQQTQ